MLTDALLPQLQQSSSRKQSTFQPQTSIAENHVSAQPSHNRYSIKTCRYVTSLPFSSLSVQGHQKPAAPYPVHWAGPQPVQMQDRRLPQVFPQGISASLSHEVLSRTERPKPPSLRPDSLLRQTEPQPGDPSQAPYGLVFPPLVHTLSISIDFSCLCEFLFELLVKSTDILPIFMSIYLH